MRGLVHPNIIRIKDTFETDHVIFIVMELVRGGDLFDRIVEKGKYGEEAARIVMQKLLSAVQYLHENNIIHRDLKPENVLLVSPHNDTDVKLTDFGLAKKASQEGLKTFCGTPQYFAPEVLKRKKSVSGSGRYGTSADMWSLGVVLYILLSGDLFLSYILYTYASPHLIYPPPCILPSSLPLILSYLSSSHPLFLYLYLYLYLYLCTSYQVPFPSWTTRTCSITSRTLITTSADRNGVASLTPQNTWSGRCLRFDRSID